MTHILFLISVFFAATVTLDSAFSHGSVTDNLHQAHYTYPVNAEPVVKAVDKAILPKESYPLEDQNDFTFTESTSPTLFITPYKIGEKTQEYSHYSTSLYSIRAPPQLLM